MRRWLVALGVALASPAALAATPSVPTKLPYQGVLLDAGGTPRTGPVDLTLRIYDGASGGSLVYKQVFLGVPLTDGVFTVNLGPTGSATDAPSNPLTTTLASVFSAEVGATGIDRFLEITVGAEGALARTQILTAPFALRSASADSAASVAGGGTIGGTPAAFVDELWQFTSMDGQNPPNSDPREGFLDTDGDGIPNLRDTDNDGDGIADSSELNGLSMNLVSPTISSVSPTTGSALGPSLVTVTGSNFIAPLSVIVGSQTPTPTSVTSTSFQVLVGPQTVGSKTVRVTNSNGEAAVSSFTFTVATFTHAVTADLGAQLHLDVRGAGQLVLSSLDAYGATPIGQAAAPSVGGAFASEGSDGQIAVGFDASSRLLGLRCRNTAADTCNLELSADLDADLQLGIGEVTATLESGLTGSGATAPRLFSPDLALDGTGRPVLGYAIRSNAGTRVFVAYDRNGDGDFADSNEKVLLSSPATAAPASGSVAVDAAGRVAFGWVETDGVSSLTKLARDRNGDGDFADASEIVTLQSSSLVAPPTIGVAYDPSNRVGVIHSDPNILVVKRDLNDDGDFLDAGEDEASVFIGTLGSVDATGSAGGGFAMAHVGGAFFRLLVDRNNDGDFADPTETVTFFANGTLVTGTPRVAVARSAAGTSFVAIAGDTGGQVFIDPEP